MGIKISELAEATAVGDSDILPIVQDGTTKKAAVELIKNVYTAGTNIDITNNTISVLGNTFKAYSVDTITIKDLSQGNYYNTVGSQTFDYVDGTFTANGPTYIFYNSKGIDTASHSYYEYMVIEPTNGKVHVGQISKRERPEQWHGTHEVYNLSDIQNIPSMQQEISDLYAQVPTNVVSGDVINVQDSSNLPIKELDLLGNATQDGTPTPDSPQDIHVVTGDNTLVKIGKNLFNKADITSGKRLSATGLLYNDASYFTSNFIRAVAGTTYTKNSPTADAYHRIAFYSKAENTDEAVISVTTDNTAQAPAGTKYLRFCGANTELDTSQIEVGTGSTFEPYTETTQLLSLGSIELAKIPNTDYKDRMFHAVSSNNPLKPSYYDTLPSEVKASLTSGSWYKQGNVYKYNNWSDLTSSTTNTNTIKMSYRFATPTIYATRGQALSNCFQNIISNDDTEHFFIGTGNVGVYNGLNIFISKTRAEDSTQAITWLTNNGVVLYYVGDTPTYTEITDTTLIEQLNNAEKMRTIKNTTNGWIEPTGTNAQAGMVLVYRQDEETLFNDLKNAILSLGGNV